ncbi:MAG: biopolymer transporter ExbD [Bdellovibrionota bacterium]
MTFDRQLEDDGIYDINITPFVDVVLVLLVIFMVTAPMMVQQALTVDLPNSQTADSLESSTLAIAITAQGQYLLNGKLVLLEDLKVNAAQSYAQDQNTQVVFAADLDSRHEAVIKAMDVIRQSGITRFAFQVIKQD